MKKRSRIIAFLLVMSLLVQFMPTQNAAVAAEPAEQTINFLESGYDYNTATLANSGWEVNREKSTVITDQVGGNNIRAGVGADYRAWSAGQTLTFNFNINADGNYKVSAIPSLIFGATDGCEADIFVDDIKVGNINWAVNASGDAAYPTIAMDSIELKASATHRLTIKRTNESGGEWGDIKSITFTPVAETAEQSIHFGASGYNYSTATLANSGWEVNREKSTVITDGVSLNDIRESSGNKYAGYRAWFAGQTLTFNFNIKADGYYKVTAVPALLFGAADGCVADIFIDDIKVGSINWAVNASGDAQYPTVELDSVYLDTSSTHTFTIKRTNSTGGEYGGIRSITFTPAEEPAEQSIHFGASGYNYSTATLANSGWEVNLNKSTVITDGVSLNDIRDHSGNKYAGFRAWSAGQTLTFNFNIKADGYYKVTAVPALLFGPVDGCTADILIDDIKAGSIDWAVNASGDAQYPTVELDGVYLDANSTHTFTIKRTNSSGGQYGGIRSITFAETEFIGYNVNFGANASTITDVNITDHGWKLNTEKSSASAASAAQLYTDAFTKSVFGYNEVMAIDFKIPADGIFSMELDALQVGNHGMRAALYVDEEYIGEVDFSHPEYSNVDSDVEKKLTAKLKTIELTGKDHTLYIKRINQDSHRHHTLWLYKLSLKPADELTKVKEVKLGVSSGTMLVGDSKEIDVKAVMEDNTFYTFATKLDGSRDPKNYIGEIISSDSSVVEVKDGKITALKEGRATVGVTVYVNGDEYKASAEINVIAIKEGEFSLIAGDVFPIRVDLKRQVILQGILSNVIVDLSKAEKIEVESDNPEIAEAEIISQNGEIYVQVTGISAGETSVNAEVEYDVYKDTVTIPVTVKETVESTRSRTINFAANAASYEELTIEKHGWSVDMKKTSAEIFDRDNSTLYQNWRTKLHLEYGEEFVINFPIEKSGYYSLDLMGTQVEMYGLMAAFYIDDAFVGEFNFSDPDGEDEEIQGVVEHFRDIYMEEGVRELKIVRINDTDYRHAFLWLENMKVTPSPSLVSVAGINVECEKDKLLLGDTVDTSFSLRLSDGNDYHFPEMLGGQGSFVINSLTPERASYENGKITAKAPGRAVFEIKADTVDYGEFTGYWQIEVAEGQLFDFRRIDKTVQAKDIKMTEAGWQVNAEETAPNIMAANPFYLRGENGFYACFKENEVLALDVNISKDGIYDVDAIGTLVGNHGAQLAFYIDDTYLGEYNFAHPDGDVNDVAETRNVTELFNSIKLTAGKHTLYIKRINSGTYRHNMMYLNRLVLTQAEVLPQVSTISVQAESNQVVYKHTLQPEVTVWMTNGRKYLFGNKLDGNVDDKNKLTFSSSDAKVFTVDEVTGTMTGVAVGNADFIAKAIVRGETHSQNREFETVRVLSIAAENELFVTRTESASTYLTAVLDDLPVNLYDATDIRVIPDDPAYLEGVIIKEEGQVQLQITGLRAVETSVTVIATLDGVIGSVEVPVHVFAPTEVATELDMNFVTLSGSPSAATIASNGWSVNREETSDYVLNGATFSLNSMGFAAQMQEGDKLVLDFFVKESGNYALDMYGCQVGNFGLIAAIYIDDMYLGEFNFAHPSDAESDAVNERDVLEKLNSLTLTPGKHKITIKRINNDTYRHAYMYLSAFDFEKIDGDLYFENAVASVGKSELIVGESTELTTGAQMSDGSWRKTGNLMDGSADAKNKISVQNSNPDVAEIKDGRIVAKAKGDTTITVTAMVDGEEKTASVPVHVSDAKISEITAEVDGDIYVGKTVDISISAKATNGADVDVSCLTVATTAENGEIATGNGAKITGISAGETNITVTAGFDDENCASVTLPIVVLDDGLIGIKVNAIPRLIKPDSEGTQITVTGGSYQGLPIDLSTAEITYTTEATDIIELSPTGYVTPKALGNALVKVKVVANGGTFEDEGEVNIVVTNGKVGRSYYTEEKVAAVKENTQKYSWARAEANGIIATAEKYLNNEELLWDAVTSQELPRTVSVGLRYDPEIDYCRYCGENLSLVYGNPIYSYNIDPINNPWEIQCKICRRTFPTNDFGSFYKLGIVEKGEESVYDITGGSWSYEKAHYEHYNKFAAEYAARGVESYEEHKRMREAGERLPAVGYLKNEKYTDIEGVRTINVGRGLSGDETVESWGVDDGYGYKTGHVYKNTNGGDVEEVHTYIAMYNRAIMGTADLFDTVVQSLSQAYMITGEAKYGRACAIALDRIADVYPDMFVEPYVKFNNTNGGAIYRGKLEGKTWEADTPWKWAMAYDAVWPIFDDPMVVNFLNEKAEHYGMANDKSTPELIRQNIEDGILRQIYIGCMDGDINGNFGLHQTPLATAAVVLDTMPETKEMLDYLMRYDENYLIYGGGHTGGEVLHKLYNDVNRDGGTAEGNSPNYQNLWYNSVAYIADVLNGYEGYAAADLYKNPKLSKMLKNQMDFVMCRRTSLPVGDSGVMAGLEIMLPGDVYFMNAYRATGDIEFAQILYFMNGNSVNGLHQDIYTKDPEKIQQDIQKVIQEHGEYDFDRSTLLAGTGFAVMRDGSLYAEGTTDEYDNQRDFWMNFGLTGIHGHRDTLGLGLHAYGLDFAPDLGYPYPSDLSDHHRNWGMSSLSHNLVIVDDRPLTELNTAANPLHFDSTDRVKVMDVDAAAVYGSTDVYRRTVVMIEANDDISYGVDFFRVKGGDEHLYSFHASSHNIGATSGFKAIKQDEGSYAGEDVAYQSGGYTNGYSYLTDVRRDTEPGTGEVMVEFDITDYRKAIKDSSDMHLRLTMLNDFDLSNVALAKGEPPRKKGNPEWIEFFLARRSGKNLDSTFTTVIEPYKGERYIKETEQVSVKRADGKDINTNGDVVRAIKVTLENGREDYVIYATNNQVEYIIDEDINFQGFVGVYTVNNGEMLNGYINHGTKLGDMEETVSEYNGEIVDFTRGMKSFENEIIVSFNDAQNVDLENLAGRHIYVENDGAQNGVYGINNATDNGDGTATLHLGNLTLVRSATNITAEDADYVYNIAPKQYFTIPLSANEETAPVFAEHESDYSLTAGKSFNKTVTAECVEGRKITYSSPAIPRGASINPESGEISWTPDSTQVGKNHIAVCADDGVSQTTIHLNLTVYKSSGSISGGSSNNSSSDNSGSSDTSGGTDAGTNTGTGTESGSGSDSGTGTGSGGGGAAGGGGGSSSGGDTSGDTGTGNDSTGGDNTGDVGDGVLDVPGEKFIDLTNHTWAKDAIYALVDAGVVNGTSENTYSPASNIKRADFAIMLVRAFGVTEGETEHFADVDINKYYAKELLLAKANGIVGGIGDNKFNPEGEITRQDMMLMLTRALEAQGKKLEVADESVLYQFVDAAEISDYARSAVASVVKAGIIAGSNGRINPLARATRAEIAVMLNRVLAK